MAKTAFRGTTGALAALLEVHRLLGQVKGVSDKIRTEIIRVVKQLCLDSSRQDGSTWEAGYLLMTESGLDTHRGNEPHPGGGPHLLSQRPGLNGRFRSPASALSLYYCSVTGAARRTHEAESRGNRVSWMSRPSDETLAHRSGVCCDGRTGSIGLRKRHQHEHPIERAGLRDCGGVGPEG